LSRQQFFGDVYWQLGGNLPPGISQVLEHIATKFQWLSHVFGVKLFKGATSGIAQRRHPAEIQDGGRQNEMYIFYGCMADERQFVILSERI